MPFIEAMGRDRVNMAVSEVTIHFSKFALKKCLQPPLWTIG